jgi:CPA2 family monovalent cation:H+ antiporter-2
VDFWYLLLELTMLLGVAFLLGATAQRLRQSPIIGYLLAGTIVGPLLFNAEAVNQSAELGVSLLLFSIGLEFSLKHLLEMGRLAFGGGSLQVAITMAAATLGVLPFTGFPQAVTIGAMVALSSTAVVLRVLVDRAETDSVRGRSCLAILLMQDIAIVPLVLIVSLLLPQAAETTLLLYLLKIVGAALGLAFIWYMVLHYAVPALLSAKGLFANRELTVLLAIVVGLGSTWGAHALNISPALGAFIAGMLLGESPFATQLRADIGSLRTVMVTLFFASVGMFFKPHWFLHHIHWILPLALAIFLLKSVVVFAVGRLFALDRRNALATGFSLGQIGEFSFVLASMAHSGGLFGETLFDLIISTIIVLMFAAPYMVGSAFALGDRLLAIAGTGAGQKVLEEMEHVIGRYRVLVVGIGPAGLQVVRRLREENLEVAVIDVNPHSRHLASELGVSIHMGDAANEEILMHAGLGGCCLAVVTVPDTETVARIVKTIRRRRPHMPIAARCRYNRHLTQLHDAGADIVVDEETMVGHLLARRIAEYLRNPDRDRPLCGLSAAQTCDAEERRED